MGLASDRCGRGSRGRFVPWLAVVVALSSGCVHREGIGPNVPSPELAVVAGDAQTGVVGQPLPALVSVVLRDAGNGGVPMPDRLLVWSITKGGGTIPFSTTRTDASGASAQPWTLGELATTDSLMVAHQNDGGTVATTVHVGALAQHDVPVAWTSTPATLLIPAAFNLRVADSITVRAKDKYGNSWVYAGSLTVADVKFEGTAVNNYPVPSCTFTVTTVTCPPSSRPDCANLGFFYAGVYVISLSLGIADAPLLTVRVSSY